MSLSSKNKSNSLFKTLDSCCGCSACYNICPVEAIKMETDNEGFLYPVIDTEKCINCNKCMDICAFKKHQNANGYINTVTALSPNVYAVKHKNFEVRINSRSGGVFTALSDYILKNNGVVYGCILTDDFNAVHIKAENTFQRDKMRGSKYIQSTLGDIFKDIALQLNNGIPVLFSGTSCQIAGLRSFLKKKYDNLFCVDIVCHGVPSPKIWKDYLKYQEEKNNGKCIFAEFRNKIDFGWKSHIETLAIKNNNDDTVKKVNSEIFKSLFYGHNIIRPSCYSCPYKATIHPGDITIADYWGIDNAAPGFNDDKGVSLVIINNKVGQNLFKIISEDIEKKDCLLENSMQPPLIKPFPKPIERDFFWKDFENKGFDYIVKKYADKNINYKFLIYYLKAKRKIKSYLK